MTGHAWSRVQGRDFELSFPRIFQSFAPERSKVKIVAENQDVRGFGKGNAARGEDRGVMFGARWNKLLDSTMLSSGQSKSWRVEILAKLGNIFRFRLVLINLIIVRFALINSTHSKIFNHNN